MKNSIAAKFSVVTFLSIAVMFGSAADGLGSDLKPSEDKGLPATPKGVAPLAGVAVVLPRNADDSREYAWSLRLSVPKVLWEVVGRERPKLEWSKIKADVKVVTIDVSMGYHKATALGELGQNRVLDLKGKRLSREELHKRLASSTPILVSVSGEMPDPFYLQCMKADTLVILFGLPSSREYNLLPTSRVRNQQAEDGAGQAPTAPESK